MQAILFSCDAEGAGMDVSDADASDGDRSVKDDASFPSRDEMLASKDATAVSTTAIEGTVASSVSTDDDPIDFSAS